MIGDDATQPAHGSTNANSHSVTASDRDQTLSRYVLGDALERTDGDTTFEARDPVLGRDVLIRVIKAQPDGSADLLATARALSKVRHPSLVPIFDVGQTNDGIYVVMPRIDATTLREWLEQGSPRWHDVVARMLPAASGLAAAHEAGVTHRALSSETMILDGQAFLVNGFALTPTQQANEEAAADQKAFRDELRNAVSRRSPPAWLVTAAERSWPSISAFATYVERRLRTRRRLMIGGIALAAVVTALFAALVLRPRTQTGGCPDPAAKLAGVWDASVEAKLATGFQSAAPVIAAESVKRVVPALNKYAERWSGAQIAICRTARAKPAEPVGLFDRRQACLERRFEAFRSLTGSLAKAVTAMAVVRADEAVAGLPDIDDCLRDEQLLAMAPRPSDPSRRASIDAIDAELDGLESLRLEGKNKEGLERTAKALEQARTVDHAPLLARALFLRAGFEQDARLETSEATLRELTQVAADARDDTLAAYAWIRLMNVLASSRGKPAEAQALEPVATAAVQRAGAPLSLEFELHLAAGGAQMSSDNLDAAEAHLRAALEKAGDERRRAVAALFRAKVTMLKRGPGVAIPLANEALAVTEKAMGPNHPMVASVLDLLAQANTVAGNFDDAETHARRAVTITEGVYGPLHSDLSAPLRVLAHIHTARGKYAEARDFAKRGVAIAESIDDPHQLATAHIAFAQAVTMADGFAAAKPHFQLALETMEKVRGREHQAYVRFENEYAAKLVSNGLCDEAAPMLAHSIAFFESKRPELTAMPRYHRAECAMKAGMTDDAVADYQRALADCKKATCEPAIVLSTAGTLGRVLVETGRDRARGAELLNEARAGFEAKGMASYLAETDRVMKALGVKRR